MVKIRLPRLVPTLLLLWAGYDASAQVSSEERVPWRRYHQAEEAFAGGQYRVAAVHARAFLEESAARILPRTAGDAGDKARYILYTALLRDNQPGSADSATAALAGLTHPAYRSRLSLALAQYYFVNRRLPEAIPLYENAGIAHLTNKEIADSKFELAYSYFNTRRLEESEALFRTIKDVPEGKYFNAGNYYYGLLSYTAGRYDEALKSFDRIDELPDYRGIVPYYMAEIYYFQGDRPKALAEAQRLLRRSDKLYYDNELHLLSAQILFEDGRYGDALPYFEHYFSNAQKVRKEELYEMGYSYYRVNEWSAAIEKFKPLSTANDSLGQTAMYLLGDSYLKQGDKRGARTAFGLCAAMPWNAGQREAALLLHARLSYELGFNADAGASLADLLRDFPQTAYRTEARTLQSELLLKSGSYASALAALEEAGGNDETYRSVLQKAAYGRAMEMLKAGDRSGSDSLLRISLANPVDDAWAAAARFWYSDILYANGDAAGALNYGNTFVRDMARPELARRVQNIAPQATVQHAYLNMGYAAMDNGRFAEARELLRKAGEGGDSRIAAAASLREADAAFMQKDFAAAAALYDRSISGRGSDADYARLQKATLLGLTGKTADKIALLQSLIAATPPSVFAPDARYELSAQYMEDGQAAKAVPLLQSLATDRREPIAAKAGLKLGIALQTLDQDEQAIAAYTAVVRNYPASEHRAPALAALRNLYIERNAPDQYAGLLRETGLTGADDAELDSAFYAAGEARFAAADWNGALAAFGKYDAQYPNGIFHTKSLYYTAESQFALKNNSAALKAYEAVLALPANDFTETSAGRAAALAYAAGQYEDALRNYALLDTLAGSNDVKLTARAGMMRSASALGSAAAAKQYAESLLALENVSPALAEEAAYYRALGFQAAGNSPDAEQLFTTLQKSGNAVIAGDARYAIATGLFRNGKLREAEEAANRNIRLGGSPALVLKNYFLLADILVAGKDYFNARALLQSIVKNNREETARAEALRKLQELDALEKESSKLSEE